MKEKRGKMHQKKELIHKIKPSIRRSVQQFFDLLQHQPLFYDPKTKRKEKKKYQKKELLHPQRTKLRNQQ